MRPPGAREDSDQQVNEIEMKPFSLEEYIKDPSRKVVTKDGRDVRIICTDRDNVFPIIALVRDKMGENIYGYDAQGTLGNEDEPYSSDLFFAPVIKEGWVNLYQGDGSIFCGSRIYDSVVDAGRETLADELFVTTTKITWEE